MKHKILFLLFFLGGLLTGEAQDKPLELSVRAYGGYGLFTPHSDFFTDITSYNTGAFHNIKYGLGNGVHAGAGVLLKLNGTISAGLDVDYLTGSKTASNNTNGDSTLGTFKSNHAVFSLVPNISFKLFSTQSYHIYNTIGLPVALKTKFEIHGTTSNSSGSSNQSRIYKYGINLGFQDALGVQFPVAKHISIFGQITGYYLPSNPHSLDQVSSGTFTINGTTYNSTFITHLTFKSNAGYGYAAKIQTSGSGTTTVSTFTEDAFPQPQRIFSVGLNAGVVVELK